MEFDLTETQKLFKQEAREFFARELPATAVREMIEQDRVYSDDLWAKLAEQGWTGLIFPESAGGMELGFVELAVAFEEMGRALVPGAFLSTIMAGAVADRSANAPRREEILRAICEGKTKATVALLESSANWQPDAVAMQAAESAEGLKLTGAKLFVSDAGAADLLIVAARLGNDLALATVDPRASGVTITPMPGLDASRHLYEIAFDGAKGELLARGDEARAALEYGLDVATLAVSAEMVGSMQWILDTTVEFAKTRKQFGKPIGQFMAVQHHCANILLMTESARSAVFYAAWVMGNDAAQAPLAVSMAKAYASDSYREAGNLGIQVHGGTGFTWEHDIHFYYKRAKASELLFGDATFHRERIAKFVIDRAREQTLVAGR